MANDPFDILAPGEGEVPGPEEPVPALIETPVSLDGLTLEEKQVFLRDLKEAYYSGTHRVRFRERDVTYRKLTEMKAIIEELESSLKPRRRRAAILTTFSRGY